MACARHADVFQHDLGEQVSLAQEPPAPEQRAAKSKRAKHIPDRRQPALLLPLAGNRKTKQQFSAKPAVTSIRKRSRGA